MNSKQLHKHSLPIIVLSAGAVVASALAISQIMLAVSPGSTAIRALTERQFGTRPATSTSFIHHDQSTSQINDATPFSPGIASETGLGTTSTAGQSAILDAGLIR